MKKAFFLFLFVAAIAVTLVAFTAPDDGSTETSITSSLTIEMSDALTNDVQIFDFSTEEQLIVMLQTLSESPGMTYDTEIFDTVLNQKITMIKLHNGNLLKISSDLDLKPGDCGPCKDCWQTCESSIPGVYYQSECGGRNCVPGQDN